MLLLFAVEPAAEEHVIRPHHGQREEMVHVWVLVVVDVSEYKLPPRFPVFVALRNGAKGFHEI